MVHGDLKGVRFRRLEPLSFLTEFTSQGQYTNQPSWPRLLSRFRSTYDHLGPHKPVVLELIHTAWHSPMDESRAHPPTAVRARKQLPNEIFGLLCSWHGHIRNHQREPAVPQTRRHNRFCDGIGG
jgi:hypothetical protein